MSFSDSDSDGLGGAPDDVGFSDEEISDDDIMERKAPGPAAAAAGHSSRPTAALAAASTNRFSSFTPKASSSSSSFRSGTTGIPVRRNSFSSTGASLASLPAASSSSSSKPRGPPKGAAKAGKASMRRDSRLLPAPSSSPAALSGCALCAEKDEQLQQLSDALLLMEKERSSASASASGSGGSSAAAAQVTKDLSRKNRELNVLLARERGELATVRNQAERLRTELDAARAELAAVTSSVTAGSGHAACDKCARHQAAAAEARGQVRTAQRRLEVMRRVLEREVGGETQASQAMTAVEAGAGAGAEGWRGRAQIIKELQGKIKTLRWAIQQQQQQQQRGSTAPASTGGGGGEDVAGPSSPSSVSSALERLLLSDTGGTGSRSARGSRRGSRSDLLGGTGVISIGSPSPRSGPAILQQQRQQRAADMQILARERDDAVRKTQTLRERLQGSKARMEALEAETRGLKEKLKVVLEAKSIDDRLIDSLRTRLEKLQAEQQQQQRGTVVIAAAPSPSSSSSSSALPPPSSSSSEHPASSRKLRSTGRLASSSSSQHQHQQQQRRQEEEAKLQQLRQTVELLEGRLQAAEGYRQQAARTEFEGERLAREVQVLSIEVEKKSELVEMLRSRVSALEAAAQQQQLVPPSSDSFRRTGAASAGSSRASGYGRSGAASRQQQLRELQSALQERSGAGAGAGGAGGSEQGVRRRLQAEHEAALALREEEIRLLRDLVVQQREAAQRAIAELSERVAAMSRGSSNPASSAGSALARRSVRTGTGEEEQ